MSQLQSNYPRDVAPPAAKVDLYKLQGESQMLIIAVFALGTAAGILQMATVTGHTLPPASFIRSVCRVILNIGPFITMGAIFKWSMHANDCLYQLRGYEQKSSSVLVGISSALSWLCLFIPFTMLLDFLVIRTEDGEGQIMRWYLPISRSPLVVGFGISSALWAVFDLFSTPRHADLKFERWMIVISVGLYFVAFYCLLKIVAKVLAGMVSLAKSLRSTTTIGTGTIPAQASDLA